MNVNQIQLIGRIENGVAIAEDFGIGVRVSVRSDGNAYIETTRPRLETMMHHSARINEMTNHLRQMLNEL